MVFLKADAARKLEALQAEKMMAFRPVVEFVESAWKRILLHRGLQAILPYLIRAESHCRRSVPSLKCTQVA